MNTKEPVRIRHKKLKGGAISLYLDIYYKGKREYEFLSMYLIDEKTKADKERNKQTMRLAEAIKSKRILELVNGTYKIGVKIHTELLLYDYAESVFAKRKYSSNKVYRILLYHLSLYDKGALLVNIDKKWIDGFQMYLDTYKKQTGGHLSSNTKNGYLAYLTIVLKQAVKDEFISNDVSIFITKYRVVDPNRNYLTIEEIRLVASNEFPICNRYRDAFLFSCLTGLRRGDVIGLTWGDVVTENGMTRISYKQEKTDKYEHLDITTQALQFMGERGGKDEQIFKLKKRSPYIELKFNEWIKELTGKKLTFHCARHSFAVMMISLGVDIYTIQKLLGHSSVNTTEIYAKILDKQKQSAVNLIPQI